MKTATIRKALLSTLAASAVLASTPALAQDVRFGISFGSPGYSQPYGYGQNYGRGYGYRGNDLQYRAQALSQHINRLTYERRIDRREAQRLSAEMRQYQNLEYRYARNGLSAREYNDLAVRLQRIEYRLDRVQRVRW